MIDLCVCVCACVCVCVCVRSEGGFKVPEMGRIKYAGRAPSAATSTGYAAVHAREQATLVDQALNVNF